MGSQKNRSRLAVRLVALFFLLLAAGWVLSSPIQQRYGALVINEFVASNITGLTDEDGDYSDWIEILNPGPLAINLGGWSITDDPTKPEKWTFPDRTLASGEYLVIFASGKNRKSAEPGVPLHTNFKLQKQGDFLALYNNLELVSTGDSLRPYPAQFIDVAYGRYENELPYAYLAPPTPGKPNANTSAWQGAAPPVSFSVPRGFYDAPFKLELTSDAPAATIHYTTDGSIPTTGSPIYVEPLTIAATTLVRAFSIHPDFMPSPATTHSYIFLDNVLTQSAASYPGFPETWGVHSGEEKGFRQGSPVIADYEMDPEIVYDPRYRDTIKDDLKSIPSLSLVTDMASFAELYSNPEGRGPLWEYPVSVELIEADNSQAGFQINAGLRIQGDASRRKQNPKHSFRLFFRGAYGESLLDYPLFPDSPVREFDSLILRGGYNRSFIGLSDEDPKLTTYTRDEWLRASQIAMSGIGSHGIFVQLYLNGLYWGLYNVVERPDAAFSAAYMGGQAEDWFAMSHGEPISGSDERFRQFEKTFLGVGGSDGLTTPDQYEAVKPFLDTAHFSDYVILNWYAGNIDWVRKNWYASVQNPFGQIRHFVWDAERIWTDGAEIVMDQKSEKPNKTRLLFHGLIQNPDFKIEFADRMYKHLFNDGALTDANAQARWLELNSRIDRAIVGESARWGDAHEAHYDSPITRDDWLEARDDVLAQMDGNANKLISLARASGYYPSLDPPSFNQHGGLVETGFELSMQAPEIEGGTIYFTTDGADPRLQVSGQVAAGAVPYQNPVVLTATTHIKARVYSEDSWSALNEATFRVTEQLSQIRISEIMYNPPGGSAYEFIELKNVGSTPMNLAGMSFEGIIFTFPDNAPALGPGEFVVLASNPQAFAERYPDVTPGGTFQAQLSNQGEEIILKDSQDKPVISLKYDDEAGWPISPDGRGDSLIFANLDGDPNDPKNWRSSSNLDGSPGADDPAQQTQF